jgi:hypothetical protein
LSAAASSHLPNIGTDISPKFLHSKPSMPGVGSGVQTYRTCKHQQQKSRVCTFFLVNFLYNWIHLYKQKPKNQYIIQSNSQYH